MRGLAAGGSFQFAFAEAITLAFNEQQIDVMSQAVDEGGDASGIGKDGVPVFEDAIGGDDDRAALVTTIDDFEEQVGSTGVIREITNLVNAKQCGTSIEGKVASGITAHNHRNTQTRRQWCQSSSARHETGVEY